MLGKAMNEVKALAQRLQEQMQAQQQQNGGQIDPKDLAKIKGQLMISAAKAENARESHSQRTSQRVVQYALEQKRDAEKHRQEMAMKAQEHALDIAAEKQKQRLKAFSE